MQAAREGAVVGEWISGLVVSAVMFSMESAVK